MTTTVFTHTIEEGETVSGIVIDNVKVEFECKLEPGQVIRGEFDQDLNKLFVLLFEPHSETLRQLIKV